MFLSAPLFCGQGEVDRGVRGRARCWAGLSTYISDPLFFGKDRLLQVSPTLSKPPPSSRTPPHSHPLICRRLGQSAAQRRGQQVVCAKRRALGAAVRGWRPFAPTSWHMFCSTRQCGDPSLAAHLRVARARRPLPKAAVQGPAGPPGQKSSTDCCRCRHTAIEMDLRTVSGGEVVNMIPV